MCEHLMSSYVSQTGGFHLAKNINQNHESTALLETQLKLRADWAIVNWHLKLRAQSISNSMVSFFQ